MFATSCPCAVTTSGARVASAAARPAGTRKWAYVTSGSNSRRDTPRVPEERDVARLSSGPPVDDRAFDLVTAREELALEARDEDPEVGIVRPRVHLGDEQDPQRCYPRVTWRIPRHISSVVPSPQRT